MDHTITHTRVRTYGANVLIASTGSREHEQTLLQLYFDTLQNYDVDLSWDKCWHGYRHYAPAGLIMAVIASMIVGETERGNDMFMVMAKRSAAMCRDLDSISVIQNSQS